jgi:murein DD-endopeptidase MepM/ murein hydrolase activator NlpD
MGWGSTAFLLIVPLVASAQGVAVTGADADSAVARGRQYTAWFYAREYGHLAEHATPETRAKMDTGQLRGFREQVDGQLGAEHTVIREDVEASGPLTTYIRTVTVEKIAQAIVVKWMMVQGGAIAGLRIEPEQPASEAPTSFLDYQTKTVLRLPFDGPWTVVWGGRTLKENRYASLPDQRFAADFAIVRDGRTHRGEGRVNTDYYCFGQPVLAPGAGTVVEAVDSVADNAPAATNQYQPLGNEVVIDHGNGEFSFLTHLERGSVHVAAGDHVTAGERVGACGNSGWSAEPHLHYNLQTTPSYLVGAGMPAQFEHYTANGAQVARGEPTRGQVISTP